MSDEPTPGDGPQLTREGVLEGRAPAPAEGPVPPVVPAAPEAPLELVERPPRGDRDFALHRSYRDDPTSRRRRWPFFIALPVAVALGLVAFVVSRPPPKVLRRPDLPALPAPVADVLPVLAGPPVVIESTPAGATITLPDGSRLGVTPWAGNNPFLTDTTLTLKLAGHRPATVQIPGAKEATRHVALRPK
ncbi:MAG: hypothetical protein SFW67_09715 [Myxococcaceae bacterium]|nr:hypothetical protein [Myxococcaceae bacterium]